VCICVRMFLFLIYVFVIVAVAFRSLRARHNYHSHLPDPRVVVASIRRLSPDPLPPAQPPPLERFKLQPSVVVVVVVARSLVGWLAG